MLSAPIHVGGRLSAAGKSFMAGYCEVIVNMCHRSLSLLKLAGLFGGLSLLLLAIVVVAYQLIQFRHRVASEYAVEETTDMICMYWVDNHDMPQSWGDLKDIYQVVDSGYGLGPHGLERLKRTVTVDFDLLRSSISVASKESVSAEPTFVTLVDKSQNISPAVIRFNARIRDLVTEK